MKDTTKITINMKDTTNIKINHYGYEASVEIPAEACLEDAVFYLDKLLKVFYCYDGSLEIYNEETVYEDKDENEEV